MILQAIQKLITYLKFKKAYCYITPFYALLLFFLVLDYKNIELFGFPGGIVSIATANKIDIGFRISAFYHALLYSVCAFIFLVLILNILDEKKALSHPFIVKINYISFIGLLGIFVWKSCSSGTTLIDASLVLQIILVFDELVLSKKIKKSATDFGKDFYLWAGLTAFFFFFPVKEMFVFLGVQVTIRLFWFLFPALILLVLTAAKVLVSKQIISLSRLVSISIAFAFLPFVSFLSNETYMIFNQRDIHLMQPKYLYVIISLFVWIYLFILIKFGKGKPVFSLRRFLFRKYVPLFLIGILVFLNYAPFVTQSNEIFELANPANSVLRFYNFGELPFIHYLSSHMLSEQITPFIYTLLNGFDGSLSFQVYDFVITIVNYLVLYYFLYFYFKNPYVAFLISFVFPFTEAIVPFSLSFLLMSIVLLIKLFKSYSFKRLVLLGVWTIFLCLWKPEIGLAGLIVFALSSVVFLIVRFRKTLISDYVKAFAILCILIVSLLFAVSVITDTNILTNILQALNYFSANQAHGLINLTSEENRYFYYHYYLFPGIVLLIFIILLFYKGIANQRKWTNKNYLSLLLLISLYFVLVQRGLVRHSMLEGNDTFMSSFLFLILGLTVVYFVNVGVQRGILFISVVTFLISSFKFPDSKGYDSLYSSFVRYSNRFELVKPSNKKIKRVIGEDEFLEKEFDALKQFLANHLKAQSTFYDFSNTPMIYFYTQRRIPSYFNQIPISINSYYLQKTNLEELRKIDLPVVIFGNIPQNFWDNVDGIPNALRHYLLAEWIYDNYHPCFIINNHLIWIRNADTTQIESANERKFLYNQDGRFPFELKTSMVPGFAYGTLKLKLSGGSSPEITINGKPTKPFRQEGKSTFQYVMPKDTNSLIIDGHGDAERMEIIKSIYCPDTFSFKPVRFNLLKLAYVMGNYTESANMYVSKLIVVKDHSSSGKYNIEIPSTFVKQGAISLNVALKPVNAEMRATIKYFSGLAGQGTFDFDVIKEQRPRKYKIPLYTQFNWHHSAINRIEINFSPDLKDGSELVDSVFLTKE